MSESTSNALSETLRAEIESWLAEDPDPDTREELQTLLSSGDHEGLQDRFVAPLAFGTAGLRGLLGAGPNRMNHVVVARATAGLCAWLDAQVPEAKTRGICIGFDGRRKSRDFAKRAAEVAMGAGFKVFTFDHVVPTPLLAFTCLDQNTAAGIMVTASHNPPDYNGYKVYWENGAQIIPPHDEGIAGCIAEVGPVPEIPAGDFEQGKTSGDLVVLESDVERRYLDGVRALAVHPETPRDLTIAYTALHGVGDRLANLALREAGFSEVHSVPEQAQPDGRFPTVAFPNPEEDGAMDLVLALARAKNADLVIANDPDADRLAVAVPDGDGDYRPLTGNEIGCMLADYLLREQKRGTRRTSVISTVVSSPMLGAIADGNDAHFEQVLTGFKWIANRALEAESERDFCFGYEEALGYTVGTLVRDKDGIGAAAVFADLAAFYKQQGKALVDVIAESYGRYGMFLSRQVSVVRPGAEGAARIDAIMESVRKAPPKTLGDHRVVAVQDLELGTRTLTESGDQTKLTLPSSNVLLLEIDGGHRVMLRPSGTEPKIKYYFDVRVDLDGDPNDSAVIERGQAQGDAVIDALAGSLAKRIGDGGPA